MSPWSLFTHFMKLLSAVCFPSCSSDSKAILRDSPCSPLYYSFDWRGPSDSLWNRARREGNVGSYSPCCGPWKWCDASLHQFRCHPSPVTFLQCAMCSMSIVFPLVAWDNKQCITQVGYSAFRPIPFAFCYVSALCENHLNIFFPSSIYTQYPLVEAPLVAITASSLLGNNMTSFA